MNRFHKCLAIAILCSFILSVLYSAGLFSHIQLKLSDSLYGGKPALDSIVIVAIDDASLQEIGRFPWDRDVFAKGVQYLNESKVIGIDVAFFENSTPEKDMLLADALAQVNAVIPVEFTSFKQEGSHIKGDEMLRPILALESIKTGYVNVITDRDGTTRAINLNLSDTYASLAEVVYEEFWKETLAHKPSRFLVNFVGSPGSFKYYSFTDVLNERVPRDAFRKKLVFIGATSPGLHDNYFVPTSGGKAMPGVEVHANAVQTMITQQSLSALSQGSVIVLILVLSLLTAMLSSRFDILGASIVSGVGIVGYLFLTIAVFNYGVILPIIYGPLSILTTQGATTLYFYLSEKKAKKQMYSAFSKYVSKNVVDEIIKHPEMLKLGGERREITVFFSDVRGFTTISEKLTPEMLVHVLNEYLSAMTDIIQKHEGCVDKYIGDAIMAFWGAPLNQPDHAELACSASIDMSKKLSELKKVWKEQGFPEINIGVGLSSGPAVIGNMGSYDRFNYTAMGDTINLGSRLESITKQYGVQIIISEATQKELKSFVTRELDSIIVKGKKQPIRIFELVCRKSELDEGTQSFIKDFECGLALYRKQDFERAIKSFHAALKKRDDYASKEFIKRCETFLKSPPAKDWNGVWEFTTK